MWFLTAKTPLGQAFAAILSGICGIVAHHAVRSPIGALLSEIHWRLNGLNNRLDALILRWLSNTLPKPRPSRKRSATPRPERPKPLPYPTRKAWLLHLVQPTAQYSLQVEMFLARPETRDLVAAAPQAGRLLRPLCRALGILPPEYLRLPERAQPAPKPRPVRARIPKVAPEPYPPGREIPRYVLAAARAWRKIRI